MTIEPLALFSIQFTFALIAYALAARWYVCLASGRSPQRQRSCRWSGCTFSGS